MSYKKALTQLLVSMTIWGTIGVLVHYIPLPSSIIANVRGLVGTLFLLLVLAIKGQHFDKPAIRRNLKYLLPCGAALGFNWVLLFEAYHSIGVGVGTVLYYLAPVFIIMVSPVLFKEKLTGFRCLCAAAALLGMVLTSGVIGAGESWNVRGVLLALGSAGMYAAIVLLSKMQKDISAYDTTIFELGVSAIVLLVYNALTVDFSTLHCTPGGLLLLLIVAVVHTGIAYALYFGALPHLPVQTSAICSYIDPIVAILSSALILREPMTLMSGVGAVLVLGSTLASQLKKD